MSLKKVDYLATKNVLICDICNVNETSGYKCWGCKKDLCQDHRESKFCDVTNDIIFLCSSCKPIHDKYNEEKSALHEKFLLDFDELNDRIKSEIKKHD